MIRTLPCLVLLALAAPAAQAQQTPTCTGHVTTLPATLSTPGVWCLAADLGTAIASGEAIRVATSNVTLDCHGYRISGLAAGAATQAVGIGATNKLNTVVRDCNVRGFHTAVALTGTTGGNVVEDVRSDGATVRGLVVEGDGSAVRRNRIVDVGGSTFAPGGAWGIVTRGAVDVDGNLVDGLAALADGSGNIVGVGVLLNDADAAIVQDNRIRRATGGGAAPSTGIRVLTGTGVHIRGNLVADADIGVRCVPAGSAAGDNHFAYVGTPLSGCRDDGNGVVP